MSKMYRSPKIEGVIIKESYSAHLLHNIPMFVLIIVMIYNLCQIRCQEPNIINEYRGAKALGISRHDKKFLQDRDIDIYFLDNSSAD